MSLAPLVMLSPVLLAVAYCDLRFMRIPNVLSILAVALFVISCLFSMPVDLLARITVAALVFGLGFVAFCLRMFGGGDVKILSALMLFVPMPSLAQFAYLFSASMLIGILAILGLRKLPQAAGHSWKAISGSTKFPMGISIALSGILLPLVDLAFGRL
ncbi:MAG: prepilin peptidase [Albidovulum sp.]